MRFYKIFVFSMAIQILFGSNHKFNQPFIDVAKSANPSVVSIISEIEVTQQQFNPFFNDPFFQDFFPEFKRKGQTLGSGVIINSEGYIITNNHVIDDAGIVVQNYIISELARDHLRRGCEAVGIIPLEEM